MIAHALSASYLEIIRTARIASRISTTKEPDLGHVVEM
jgi:hypothetical protein